MARRRKHASLKADIGQPVVRSPVAQAAWSQSGAGRHGKSGKAQRRADRIRIQKGEIE